MKKRGGLIWIAAGIILALLAGALAFWAIFRASSTQVELPMQQAAQVNVVVASRVIAVRELIQPGDVEMRMAPADMVPENAIQHIDNVVDWIAMTPLWPGEIILTSNVISPTIKGVHVAYTMDENKVAMAIPADDLMSSNNLLQPGDHVDVLFSIEVEVADEESLRLVTFNALQNLEIAALVRPGDLEAKAQTGATMSSPQAIVFTLDPQDALVLKHLRDIGGTVDIVLRAPEAKERFSTQPVDMNYLVDRYQMRIPVLP